MFEKIKAYEKLLRAAGKFMKENKENYLNYCATHQHQVKSKADKDINQMLLEGIHKISGSLFVISEESENMPSKEDIKRADECFIIDPIDGTASYVGGFLGYVTQIAYLQRGTPIFSLVYSPEKDDMYVACKGRGAYLNGVRVFTKKTLENIIFIDNTPHPSVKIVDFMKKHDNASYVECGSIGLKICKVASGDANIFYKDVTIRDWDVIPPALILEEAGGAVTSLSGEKMNYFSDDTFSHHGLIAISAPPYVNRFIKRGKNND
jgi:3'(2'), 5'-bisphosphate nucleotidase